MSDLTDAIDAFLAKYPDDAVLEWEESARKPTGPMATMVGDLVGASERHRENAKPVYSDPEDPASDPGSTTGGTT